jgi:predicted helicase
VSQLLIQNYLNDLQTLHSVSGTSQESVVREAFKTLLKDWGKSRDLIFLPEYEYPTLTKTRVRPDGTLMYALRVPFGYWEAKDTDDDLDEEIKKKFRKGYPQDNIIFDDSHEAILIQNKQRVMRCGVEEPAQLQKLLELFFSYERKEIADFRKAVEQFKADLPAVLKALREMIDAAERDNPAFHQAAIKFLKHAQETINPNVVAADVREMLIQHILTEEIFSQVFDNIDFHHHNNVAKQLYALEETFFGGGLKHKTLAGLRPYYTAIKSTAALVSSHHEKQNFLKVIYENFYKVYDKKKADRLGVAYTPNEIVRFMVDSTDWLCQKHFGKVLIDKNVEILDPCVGTGTFITEMIEHFRGQPTKLRYKYSTELHCNEVAILPYYVANLNIEATYAAINGYEEYPNLCFVDTLDNVAALRVAMGQHYSDLLGGPSEENAKRITRQNARKISVFIGNPPYNANQLNENNNNKNRTYRRVDEQVKATYVAASRAQKTAVYDMYARFFRWATDRLRDEGIIAFITNRSFIDSRTFDGFRATVADEFNELWIMDLGGDVRVNPKLSGTKNNVFGIQTGVAISFFVKLRKKSPFRIFYARRPEYEIAEDKLSFLGNTKMSTINFECLTSDAKFNWLNIPDDEFERHLIVASSDSRKVKNPAQARAIFHMFSTGIMSGRDDWVYDFEPMHLDQKMRYFSAQYQKVRRYSSSDNVASDIKWSRNLKRKIGRKIDETLAIRFPTTANFRPFVAKSIFASELYVDELGAFKAAFAGNNLTIAFLCVSSANPLAVLASDKPVDYGLLKQGNGGTQALYRYRYSSEGTQLDNITDWALDQFRVHYETGKESKPSITKDAIFHYVYGVLHNPAYREKYALNLKREFPRIPFYADFWR